jgi:hypothetical protein
VIRECVVTSRRLDGRVQIAPFGVTEVDRRIVIAPFRPSGTLDNLLRDGFAVVNYVADVRVIAGCVTGRREWPLVRARRIPGARLDCALSHTELVLERVEADLVRPRLWFVSVFDEIHAPFRGFNRAQAAVLEAAILVTRLDRLPSDKIERELDYLRTAVDKTAGPAEREAWGWLMERVEAYRCSAPGLEVAS